MSLRSWCAIPAWIAISPFLLTGAEIGGGAPSEQVRIGFIDAYARGIFRMLVTVPPPADVKSHGGTGYLQEFNDATKPQQKAALIYGSPVVIGGLTIQTFQLYSTVYSYYSGNAGGFATLGFPIADSAYFDGITTSGTSVVKAGEWLTFQKNSALFAWYQTPDALTGATQFTVRDPFYSRWLSEGALSPGALSPLGPPTGVETAITSSRGAIATYQRYSSGAIYNHTAGLSAGRTFMVKQPVWATYRFYGGETGLLGLPLGDERLLANGTRQQSFEGGTVEYTGNAAPVLKPRIKAITINAPNPIRLSAGEKFTVTVTATTVTDEIVTDRLIAFSTSNSRVAVIAADGQLGRITAAGGGNATILATGEGISSAPINVLVAAICCQLGEGAPSAVTDAMQAAITRNRIDLFTPIAARARRIGAGWVQDAISNDGRTRYVVAKPDSGANAYIVAGEQLALWESAGGAIGGLGYPASDLTTAGRQNFDGGSLAGRPTRLVSGAILARWAQLGYEAGALQDPTSAASGFFTFNATSGTAQSFKNGWIASVGGRALIVNGRILQKYLSLGGASGKMGAPVTEEFADGVRKRQNFEGGSMVYADSDADVTVESAARKPRVSAAPSQVAPGNKISVGLGGFEDGAQVRVAFSGTTPAFVATLPGGSFTWDVLVPTTARPETVTITATDSQRPTAQASGSYSIRAVDVRTVKTAGDSQTGAPGSLLPQALRITITDTTGTPLASQAVRWEASPGAQIVGGSVLSNEFGIATAFLRLPTAQGVALATATVGSQVLSFSAQSAARELANFPRLTQAVAGQIGGTGYAIATNGSQLATVASFLRFLQQSGQVSSANGMADVAGLNSYLRGYCALDVNNAPLCDGYLLSSGGEPFLNLWRLSAFTGGSVSIVQEPAGLARLRDLAGNDQPAIVALAILRNNAAAGTHFVVVTGVDVGGAILIHDPDPRFGRAALDEFLNGFNDSSGTAIKATIAGVFRLLPEALPGGGFLINSTGGHSIASSGGPCPVDLRWSATAGIFGLTFCDGTQSQYQLGTVSNTRAAATSLDDPPLRTPAPESSGAATFRIAKSGAPWTLQPQQAAFTADQVLNAATFIPALSPGSAISIFGAGLEGIEADFSGQLARVLYSGPFQANVVVPAGLAPGTYLLRVRGPLGESAQAVDIQRNSPGIFVLSDGAGAVVNQDGSVNRPLVPARRGQAIVVYCTGLGATERRGNLDWAVDPVRVALGGRTLTPFFAGSTPGSPGLYQVNVTLPADLAPGQRVSLRLTQGVSESNTVEISVQ